MLNYMCRHIDKTLVEWKNNPFHKPLLLRGARQVGKSSAVRHFSEQFEYFAEVNFERDKDFSTFFRGILLDAFPSPHRFFLLLAEMMALEIEVRS